MLPAAVAFHHASLGYADRNAVEQGFLKDDISIICSTSTLAVGVNLPCYLVILKGTQGYADAGLQEYSSLEVMQMLGRAGRPQYETEACAVILCLNDRLSKYEKMVAGTEVLESSLHHNLTEHLNAEISLGTIDSRASAKKWLSSTFLNVRLQQNPHYYDLESGNSNLTPDEALLRWCEKDLDLLNEARLIENSDALRPTEYGHTMARYCIKFETMKIFMAVPPQAKVSEILNALCQAAEFREFRLRQGDKTLYKELNKANEIRYPVQVDIALPQHKVSLIIQAKLGCLAIGKDAKNRFNGGHLRQLGLDTNSAINHAKRLIRCMVDIFVQRNDSNAVKSALELARSLAAGVWDGTVMQLKQVPGLGDVFTRKLAAAGIKHIDALFNTEPHRIEVILSKNPPFGIDLIKKIAEFPMLHISVRECGQKHQPGEGADIKLRCEVGFLNENVPLKFNRRSYSILFLCETSYGQLVDFRRFGPSRLKTVEEILLTPTIDRPGAKLRCHIMCDDIAGTHQYAELDVNCPVSWFPTKTAVSEVFQTRHKRQIITPAKPTAEGFDSEGVNDSDLLAAAHNLHDNKAVEDIDDIMAEVGGHKHMRKRSLTASSCEGTDNFREPQKLANGRWTCRHTCRDDEKQCKHKCCLEGVPKKPTRKRQKKDKSMSASDTGSRSKAKKTESAEKRTTQQCSLDKMLQRSESEKMSQPVSQQSVVEPASVSAPLLDRANNQTDAKTLSNRSVVTSEGLQTPPGPQQVSDIFDIADFDWQAMDEIAAAFDQDSIADEVARQHTANEDVSLDKPRDDPRRRPLLLRSEPEKHFKQDSLFFAQSSSPSKETAASLDASLQSCSKDIASSGPSCDKGLRSDSVDTDWDHNMSSIRGVIMSDAHTGSTRTTNMPESESMNRVDSMDETDYQRKQRLEEEDQRRRWAELGSELLTYESFGKYVRIVDNIE